MRAASRCGSIPARRASSRSRPRAGPGASTRRARRIDAAVVEVSALDGSAIPLQTDGDLFGEASEWRVELRPAVVPLIGGWS